MLTTLIALAMASAPTPAARIPDMCSHRIEVSLANPNGDFNGMSHSGVYLTLRNHGARACRLPGLPTVRLLDARSMPISAAREAPVGMHPGPVIIPVTLAPGDKATADLRWVSGDVYDGHNCSTPTRVTVEIGARKVSAAWPGGEICGPASKPLPFEQTPLRTDR